MDPYWAEGDVSAVDQLNRLVSRLRRALIAGTPVGEGVAEPARIDVPDVDEALSPGARRLRTLG
jgi:hypothetical protein